MALLEPEFLSVWLTGLAMLALAGWLVMIDFSSRIHRTFALLLLIRSFTFFIGAFIPTVTPATRTLLFALIPYVHIAFVMVALYFLCLFPQPRTWVAKTAAGPWLWTAATIGMMLWHILDPSAYGVFTGEFGPLSVFTTGRLMMFGIGSLVVARAYWQDPLGSAGYSRFLIYAGFALAALFDSVAAVWRFVEMANAGAIGPPSSWEAAAPWLDILVAPLVLASLWYIGLAARQERAIESLQEPRRFLLYIAPLPVISNVLASAIDGNALQGPFVTFVLGIWRLAFPFLITYALLRHQLFEVDVRVKANVARGIMVGVFTVSFFVLMEGLEALLAGDAPAIAAMGIAGGLALAGQPLRALGQRVADKLMPDTIPIVEQTTAQREQFYVDQYHLVAGDGAVTAKERTMLDELAFSLRLSPSAIDRLESGGSVADDHEQTEQFVEQSREASKFTQLFVAAAAVLAFAGVSQGLENLVQTTSFARGLASAAVLAVLIGPAEAFVDFMRIPRVERRRKRRRMATFRHAAYAAWADGTVTGKELIYLDKLQAELGLTWADRKRAEGKVAVRWRRAPAMAKAVEA